MVQTLSVDIILSPFTFCFNLTLNNMLEVVFFFCMYSPPITMPKLMFRRRDGIHGLKNCGGEATHGGSISRLHKAEAEKQNNRKQTWRYCESTSTPHSRSTSGCCSCETAADSGGEEEETGMIATLGEDDQSTMNYLQRIYFRGLTISTWNFCKK
jgi:hypothetical protein